MRKIFSSPRLENVEALARLLEAEGIEVRIEHGRALHRAIRGNFSYLEAGKGNTVQPEVWVIRSDDQPRARALMREAGLLQDTTRPGGPAQRFVPRTQAAERGTKRVSWLRYGLLAVVLVVVVVNFVRRPDAPPVAANPAPATPRPSLAMLDETLANEGDTYIIATPPLLAAMLARRALKATPADVLCLAIDGQDPADAALSALAADGIHAYPASVCPSEATLRLDVHQYTTDGSGSGTVWVTQQAGAQEAGLSAQWAVRRDSHLWSVLE